jgi:hypothetical protein
MSAWQTKRTSGLLMPIPNATVATITTPSEQIADLLRADGFNALAYHAGLDQGVRMRNQDTFVAAGAADLLVVALDVGGHVGVADEAHVGLVDAHPWRCAGARSTRRTSPTTAAGSSGASSRR